MPFIEQLENLTKSPAARRVKALLAEDTPLEDLAREAAAITRRQFGRTMRLFAPLYVSNECVNSCRYCGFSRSNPIPRLTLDYDRVEEEARYLAGQGFRSILLVAGEHPRFSSPEYLAECVRRLRRLVPSVSLEVGPMATEEYRGAVAAGADGLLVFQETYDPELYDRMHPAGPKKDFAKRLSCPERAYAAGFRRLGIGALLGLGDWRREAPALAAHAEYLLRHCRKAHVTVSFPRLRPAAGGFQPPVPLTESELTRLICALRIALPAVGLVLSTRESPRFRDGIASLGITLMSAGVHTDPGGYTGAGEDAAPQFIVSDDRSAAEVAARLRELGLDPVWKDWEYGLEAA